MPLAIQVAGVNVPVPLLLKEIVPFHPGLDPVVVSVKVAVQLVVVFSATEVGEQLTAVVVPRFTVTVVVLLLPL